MNVVSLVGNSGVSRINISQSPDKLTWIGYKGYWGYKERIDYTKTPAHYESICSTEVSSPTRSEGIQNFGALRRT